MKNKGLLWFIILGLTVILAELIVVLIPQINPDFNVLGYVLFGAVAEVAIWVVFFIYLLHI